MKPLTQRMEHDLALIGRRGERWYISNKQLHTQSVRALIRRGLVEYVPGDEFTIRVTYAGFCYIPKHER